MNITRLEENPKHIRTAAKWLYEEWGRDKPNGSVVRAEKSLNVVPGIDGLPATFLVLIDNVPVGIVRLVKNDMENRTDLSPWLATWASGRNCAAG